MAIAKAFVHGFGAYVPERVVTNEEIAARVGRTTEWIENASGIRERRWAPAEASVVDLAANAAQDCLQRCGVTASKLGMIILGSGSARPGFPGPAAELAMRLGLEGTPALDVPMASAGSLFGMVLAAGLAESQGDILVVGSEKMSALIDLSIIDLNTGITNATTGHVQSDSAPLDPNIGILFGDGAGAVLISARPGKWQIQDAVLHSDGAFRDSLSFDWASPLRMNGLSVILQASRKIPAAIQEVLARQGIAPADVTTFLMHQANQNLLVRVAKSLDVPAERFFSNIVRYGNTSSASMLIAASEWSAQEPPDGPVVFAAFGAGFHWGALVAQSHTPVRK